MGGSMAHRFFYLRATEKMFYPDLLVYELVFCVVGSPAYLDMRDFPRLEYEPISCAIQDKTIIPGP
jgi:hypothetical protein